MKVLPKLPIVSLLFLVLIAAIDVRSFYVTDFYRRESTKGIRFNFAIEHGYISAWELPIGLRDDERSWWEFSTEAQLVQAKIHENIGGRTLFNLPFSWLLVIAGVYPAYAAFKQYEKWNERTNKRVTAISS